MIFILTANKGKFEVSHRNGACLFTGNVLIDKNLTLQRTEWLNDVIIRYICLVMKNILLLLALFSLIGRSSAQSESQNMPAIQDSMMQQYQLGNYKEGKDLAIQILTIDTSNEVAIDVLAKIYDSEQNTARAIKFYTLKFQKDTLDGNVARKLAQLYAEAEIFTEAIDFYKKALSLNDRDIVSIRGFSEVYFAVDALDYADSLCEKGLEIDSNNVGLLLIDARVSYKQRDMNRVISDLEKAGNLTNLSNYYSSTL